MNSGLIAQWIEHPPSKRAVVGSNPTQSVFSAFCCSSFGHIEGIDVASLPDKQASDEGGIGALPFPFPHFADLDRAFAAFAEDAFRRLPVWERFQRLFSLLLEKIQAFPEPTFLLPAVIAYLERLNALHLFDTSMTFAFFELWLNHFSGLSTEEQARVRGKIAGKYLPREEYGRLFPISLGKVHFGSHFVSAHLSPDLDTTVASFIGWLDAFAARVGTGQHLWNLPGGPSSKQLSRLFTRVFGHAFFSILAHTEGAMRLSAMDLLTTESILYAGGARTLKHLDHNMGNTAILYVDAHGYYHGDWRGSNFEPVEQITTLLCSLLRTFSRAIHVDLLALFAENSSPENNMAKLYAQSFSQSLESVLKEINATSPYQERLDLFCKKVLALDEGLESSFQALFLRLSAIPLPQVVHFLKEREALNAERAWQGASFEERRIALFRLLHRLVHSLDQAVDAISHYVDRLDVVMRIKHDILGYQPSFATLRTDLETLRLSLGERDYLTIVLIDEEGRRTPLGIVLATTLRKEILGTVSQRDFSNPDEMRMAPYLTVISVMDHHKSALHTRTPIQALLSDAQSCNVLVAEQSFLLNDRYGVSGLSPDQIAAQLSSCMEKRTNGVDRAQNSRLVERILRKQAVREKGMPFYVHPLREYIEYFYALHAILDDTDLLSKVGMRDCQCVAELLSRLKTLCTGRETEVVSLDDLEQTPEGTAQAARRLLQSPDLHALYMTLYKLREQEIESALIACAQGADLALFADTKEQNGCCRIGQIKLFQGNQTTYTRYAEKLFQVWLEEAERLSQQAREYDLHLMMISTLESSGETDKKSHAHKDALWIWTAPTSMGLDHLTRFLSAFQYLSVFQQHPPHVTLYGARGREWQEVFAQNFKIATRVELAKKEEKQTFAIIHYPSGIINSRKTMISPFLPPLVGSGREPWS